MTSEERKQLLWYWTTTRVCPCGATKAKPYHKEGCIVKEIINENYTEMGVANLEDYKR